MKQPVKLKVLGYWIYVPYTLRLVDLAQRLSRSRLQLYWNIQQRRLEVKSVYRD